MDGLIIIVVMAVVFVGGIGVALAWWRLVRREETARRAGDGDAEKAVIVRDRSD